MKSTSLHRAAFAALVLAPVLTACGFGAQTDQVYQPATGVINRDGEVDVLNALIVSGTDGTGTFVASLVNKDVSQGDQLVSVTGPTITAPDEKIAIPADGAVNLATDGKISVTGADVKAGNFVSVTLAFANGQSTTVKVPVVRHDGDYADIPVPTATPTTGTPGDTPSGLPTDAVTDAPAS